MPGNPPEATWWRCDDASTTLRRHDLLRSMLESAAGVNLGSRAAGGLQPPMEIDAKEESYYRRAAIATPMLNTPSSSAASVCPTCNKLVGPLRGANNHHVCEPRALRCPRCVKMVDEVNFERHLVMCLKEHRRHLQREALHASRQHALLAADTDASGGAATAYGNGCVVGVRSVIDRAAAASLARAAHQIESSTEMYDVGTSHPPSWASTGGYSRPILTTEVLPPGQHHHVRRNHHGADEGNQEEEGEATSSSDTHHHQPNHADADDDDDHSRAEATHGASSSGGVLSGTSISSVSWDMDARAATAAASIVAQGGGVTAVALPERHAQRSAMASMDALPSRMVPSGVPDVRQLLFPGSAQRTVTLPDGDGVVAPTGRSWLDGSGALPPALRLCPLCQRFVNACDLLDHLPLCQENKRSCEHCTLGIPVCEYDDHLQECPKNRRACVICRRLVQIRKLPGHLSSCSQDSTVLTMYHGTSLDNAKSIMRDGFRPSVDGLLGPGVYLTRDLVKASHYGQAIVEVRAAVGRTAVVNAKGHRLQRSWHYRGAAPGGHAYDSAWIPPDCGVSKSNLEEHCVRDPSRVVAVCIREGVSR